VFGTLAPPALFKSITATVRFVEALERGRFIPPKPNQPLATCHHWSRVNQPKPSGAFSQSCANFLAMRSARQRDAIEQSQNYTCLISMTLLLVVFPQNEAIFPQ
jgi:hypothetical protein